MAKKEKKPCKILGEFKTFVMRGNVLDLAVGVIIGGAFQKIVTSAVNDLIMPFIGLITGGTNFATQYVVLKGHDLVEAARAAAQLVADEAAAAAGTTAAQVTLTSAEATAAGALVFAYGAFITAVIDFLIMAVIVFLLVKGINSLSQIGKKKEEEVVAPAEPTTKICPHCCSEIAIAATRCPHCTSEL